MSHVTLRACHCCGLIHRLPALAPHERARCVRCDGTIVRPASHLSSQRTAAATLAALVLFLPAVTLPLLEIERLGHRHSSSLLSGLIDMFSHGAWLVGGIVLLFSIVFPLAKLVILLELSLLGLTHRRHRAYSYRLMEHVGKWSMMDVLLLAFLVMLIKLGSLVEFHLGPAVIAFTVCVVMSMIASITFDPHSIWDDS